LFGPKECSIPRHVKGSSAIGTTEAAHPKEHAYDGLTSTRWASPVKPSWIIFELGSPREICRIDISWYSGNTRKYSFVVAVSTDGNLWHKVFGGKSSGTTEGPETYLIPSSTAYHLRITVNGNTQDDTASIIEVVIYTHA